MLKELVRAFHEFGSKFEWALGGITLIEVWGFSLPFRGYKDRRKWIYNEEVMTFGSFVVSGLTEYVGHTESVRWAY